MLLVLWIVLWASLGAFAWVYCLHPACLWVFAPRRRARVTAASELPGVSIILPVHNEEAVLRRKIEDCRSLDYPRDRMETIVISDGSTDGTVEILRSLESPDVRVIIAPDRIGKTEAQNRAVAAARHDILFFTDATTIHPPNVLRALVARFAEMGVGCVSGRAVFRDDASLTSSGLAIKQRYDRVVRVLLTRSRTMFGATGCVYAVCRDLYVPLRPDLVSDFVEPLELLARGYRTVFEPAAIGFVERRSPTPREEFARRSRMVLQGFRAIAHMRGLLDPRRGVFQAISLLTQRPLKWLTPLYALGVLISSIVLSGATFPRALLTAQIVFYGSAALAWILERQGVRVPRLFALPLYFSIICLAALAGIASLARGETGRTWEPVCR